MAIKGLSKLVMAPYNFDGSKVTFTNPTLTEKMAEYSIQINQTEDNPLYLDNGIAENDAGTFQNATITIQTGDLTQENSKLILGVNVKKAVQYKKGKTVDETIFDDNRKTQILGTGLIELHQIDNVDHYKAIWFPKVMYSIPNDAAVTRGAQIDWQTKELSGSVMRSDEVTTTAEEDDVSVVHPWKQEAWFDTEQDALDYLMYKGGKAVEA